MSIYMRYWKLTLSGEYMIRWHIPELYFFFLSSSGCT